MRFLNILYLDGLWSHKDPARMAFCKFESNSCPVRPSFFMLDMKVFLGVDPPFIYSFVGEHSLKKVYNVFYRGSSIRRYRLDVCTYILQ